MFSVETLPFPKSNNCQYIWTVRFIWRVSIALKICNSPLSSPIVWVHMYVCFLLGHIFQWTHCGTGTLIKYLSEWWFVKRQCHLIKIKCYISLTQAVLSSSKTKTIASLGHRALIYSFMKSRSYYLVHVFTPCLLFYFYFSSLLKNNIYQQLTSHSEMVLLVFLKFVLLFFPLSGALMQNYSRALV